MTAMEPVNPLVAPGSELVKVGSAVAPVLNRLVLGGPTWRQWSA